MATRSGKSKFELKVFISTRDSKCDECGEELGRRAWITLQEEKGALCLSCGDLDHLVFLPAGDAALTRRSRKHSGLFAIVLKWSTARKQYERQGLLVEDEALTRAEEECEADAGARKVKRAKAARVREELDREYIARFAGRVREMYPHCPPGREEVIAGHACRKYSGRVGRSADAKALDERAVRAAVTAHVRHAESEYDKLLLEGTDRYKARDRVKDQVWEVLQRWEKGAASDET